MSAKFMSLSVFYSTGVAASKIHKMHNLLEKGSLGPIHSVLLYRGDTLLYEAYFENYTPFHVHEAQSVSKSLMSMVLGSAITQGLITNLDQKIYPYFPDYHHLDWTNGKKEISLKNLLTMSTGISWNETEVPYADIQVNDSNRMAQSFDWIRYALDAPMETSPGTQFAYSSANPILLNLILEEISGLSTESFLKTYLFEPLDIENYRFFRNPARPEVLGDAFLLPRDLLKLGVLMLQKGTWLDQSLISQDWVDLSTRPHLRNVIPEENYGYWWWQRNFRSSRAVFPTYYAWGYGGQHIFIIPTLDLVLVTTAGLYHQDRANEPFHLLEKYILEAIL